MGQGANSGELRPHSPDTSENAARFGAGVATDRLQQSALDNPPSANELRRAFGPQSEKSSNGLELALNDKSNPAIRRPGDPVAMGARRRTSVKMGKTDDAGKEPSDKLSEAGGSNKDLSENAISSSEKAEAKPTIAKATALEHYEKDGKRIPIYSFKDSQPFRYQSYDPQTKVLKEGFHEPFGVKDDTKSYGGVLVDTDTSRRIVRREESGGKQTLELDSMQGMRGYGSKLGLSGDRELLSVTMWKDPDGKAYKQATIMDYNWRAQLVKSQQKPEPMPAEEFDRRWNETSPDVLNRLSSSANPQKSPKDTVARRLALD